MYTLPHTSYTSVMKNVCTYTYPLVSDPVSKVEEYKASDNGEYQQE